MKFERGAEYFDYHAGLSNAHRHRVLSVLKYVSAQTKPLGMIQEGGRNPLLGRFKGIPKGEIEIPLWYSFFRPSTALSFSYEKESGVETFPAHFMRGERFSPFFFARQRKSRWR